MTRTSKYILITLFLFQNAYACTETGDAVSAPTGSDGKADGWQPDPEWDRVRETVLLEQGWDSDDRAEMYYLDQGSSILPYAWFLALRVDANAPRYGGGRFAAPEHLRSFGFVVEGPSGANPDALPIGFARAGEKLGLTCTVCHTGQINVGDVAVRIDGGSFRGDILGFQFELLSALETTLSDDDRFAAFAHEVLESPGDQTLLRSEVESVVRTMQRRLGASAGAVVPGPGRVDGVGQATNETLCLALEMPENCDTFNSPTNPGFLWGLGDLDWVQSNGSVHGALPRNVGEALGVFGPHHFVDGEVRSDVPLLKLMSLEEGFERLNPPNWRQPGLREALPELSDERIARGAELFAETCASCHSSRRDGPFTSENANGVRFVEVPVTPLEDIGTDSGFVEDFAGDQAYAPPAFIERYRDEYRTLFGTDSPAEPVPAARLRGMIIGQVISRFVRTEGIVPGSEAFNRLFSYRESGIRRTEADPVGYRAQPLEGIAFTGPYLHNGSVRTLADLLRPAAEREVEFLVGGATFDPEAVGFLTYPDEPTAYRFDTRSRGNRNTGHEGYRYGTEFGESDRAALLEYLRAL